MGGAWRRPSPDPFHLRSARPRGRARDRPDQSQLSAPCPTPVFLLDTSPGLGTCSICIPEEAGCLSFTLQVFHLYFMFNGYGDLAQCTLMQKQAVNSVNFQVCILKENKEEEGGYD